MNATAPNTKVPCDGCGGNGRGRYPPTYELSKCRRDGCNGKGWITYKKLTEIKWY
jgi:hypothetical protein